MKVTEMSDDRALPCLYCCQVSYDELVDELRCYDFDGNFLPLVRRLPHTFCEDSVNRYVAGDQ